jgi:hypothetical protein
MYRCLHIFHEVDRTRLVRREMPGHPSEHYHEYDEGILAACRCGLRSSSHRNDYPACALQYADVDFPVCDGMDREAMARAADNAGLGTKGSPSSTG